MIYEASLYFMKFYNWITCGCYWKKEKNIWYLVFLREVLYMESRKLFKVGLHYPNVVVIEKMKSWLELRIKTNKSFWKSIMFNVADGENNRHEFHAEALTFTILIKNYKYKLNDKFEFRSFPQKTAKKVFLSFWSNLTLHPTSKTVPKFLKNFDFRYFY